MSEAGPQMIPQSRHLAGIGIVLVSALLIGLAPTAAKVAYQEGANPLAVVTLRNIIGVVAIGGYLLLKRQVPRNESNAFKQSAVSGLAQVFTALGFLGAVAFIDVSLAALIFYFHPFLVAAVGHFRGDMAMNFRRLSCIFAAVLGLALVLGLTFAKLDTIGIALSVIGMVAVTVVVLTVTDVSKSVGPIAASLYMTIWSMIAIVLFAFLAPKTGWVSEMMLPDSIKGWCAIVGAGATTTAGYVLFFVGAQIVGTTRAVIWTITEPLFAIVLAIMIVGEWLSFVQWIGVTLVVASLFLFETSKEP